jgi:O-succinylbenzoate synthase
VQPYTIAFRRPLQTAHGIWRQREGAILTLRQGDRSGQGEIAPIPWFGSETLAEAIAFFDTLGSTCTPEQLTQIPDSLPACQFAAASARFALQHQPEAIALQPAQIAHLLPTGPAALAALDGIAPGTRTVKWKIGVATVGEELGWWRDLCDRLPPEMTIRLDANGSLSEAELGAWLEGVGASGRVELIEQPLPPDQIDALLRWQARSPLPLALDEAVATVGQLAQWVRWGWRGVYVVKVAIAGDPWRLQQLCQAHQLDAIASSVFETAVGRQNALQWAMTIHNPARALGFGTAGWLRETV